MQTVAFYGMISAVFLIQLSLWSDEEFDAGRAWTPAYVERVRGIDIQKQNHF